MEVTKKIYITLTPEEADGLAKVLGKVTGVQYKEYGVSEKAEEACHDLYYYLSAEVEEYNDIESEE